MGFEAAEPCSRIEVGPYAGDVLKEHLLVLEALRHFGSADALIGYGEQADVSTPALCDLNVDNLPA